LIKEGISDGSIVTDFPNECAQLFVLLTGIWCDPITLACEMEELHNRLIFIQHTMRALGVDIVSEAFITSSMEFAESFLKEGDLK
jgi:TetR/AcrR family acrAB operon transcriptional repressor